MPGGCPNELLREVPHSLRARVGSLTAWAPPDLRGFALGTSDIHEKHTSSKSAQPQLPVRHRMSIRYRSLPCRTVSDPIAPSSTLPYCTGPSRAVLEGTHRTVPYVPDRAVPYRIYMYRNRPCPTASCAPHRTCRTCVYRTVPCCAVMSRTGPDRAVPQVP